ncbi:hypothetical protein [Kosakonia sp.]|uniref:hypothetical protein n=1 Tax=Kosakonia sp. TaxID=1916651 RepID=UPI0028971304|nr:hypothetical protein [Kosakonia sp.]
MKNIKKSLVLGMIVDKQKQTDNTDKLDSLRDRLLDRAGGPVGLQTMALPLSGSTLFTLFSYMMWQVPLWTLIFAWQGWPEYKVFAGILPAALVYILITYAATLFTAKGYIRAFKVFLIITTLTALGSVVNFIAAVISWLPATGINYTHLVTAALGLIFSVCSVLCLNSAMFYRTMAFCLHNHLWRRQINAERRKEHRPAVTRKR